MHGKVIALCVLLLAAATPDDPAPPKSALGLDGIWQLVEVERGGTAPDRGLRERQLRWVIKGDKVLYGGEEMAVAIVDPQTTPKCINLKLRGSEDDKEGIYAVEGDTLKICLNWRAENVKERPQNFATADKPNLRLLVFKRVTAAKDEELAGNGYLGIQLSRDVVSGGIIIVDTLDGGPARKAGLKKGDVLLRIGDADVQDLVGAVEAVRQVRPGSDLNVQVRRDTEKKEIKVRVGVVPFHFLID